MYHSLLSRSEEAGFSPGAGFRQAELKVHLLPTTETFTSCAALETTLTTRPSWPSDCMWWYKYDIGVFTQQDVQGEQWYYCRKFPGATMLLQVAYPSAYSCHILSPLSMSLLKLGDFSTILHDRHHITCSKHWHIHL